MEAQHSKVGAAALANQAGRPTDQPGWPPNIPRLRLPPGWPSDARRRCSSCAREDLLVQEKDLLLVHEEDLLLAQEEDLLLALEEDLLLAQEEDLLLAQEEDLLLAPLGQPGGSLNLEMLGGQPGWSVGRLAWLAGAAAPNLGMLGFY